MTLEVLKSLVETYSGIKDISAKDRRGRIIFGRYVFVHLATEKYNFKYEEVAEVLGLKRSNMYNAVKQHESLMASKDGLYTLYYNRVKRGLYEDIFTNFNDRIPVKIIETLASLNDTQLALIESFIKTFIKEDENNSQ